MADGAKVVGFLKDKEGTEVMAALGRLNVGRLNEVLAIFTRFVKSVEGNSVSYFDIFRMVQKLMANLGPVLANRHAETLMNVGSQRFSRTTDLNMFSGDARWEKILRRRFATRRIRCKHGSNVEPWSCHIGHRVVLRRCPDD
jgi:hypothetical protein